MRKGSITLYLCLILLALLSLIGAALVSSRYAAGRVVLSSAAEQGMYSLFSRFDRTLFDEYGILALDGGYNSSELKLGSLKEEAEETVEFLTGGSDALIGPDNLMHLSCEKGEVTGYTLLTDNEGEFLKNQMARALTGKKTAAAVQKIRDQLTEYSPDWKKLEQEGDSMDTEGTEAAYDSLGAPAAEGEETAFFFLPEVSEQSNIQAVLCAQEDPGSSSPGGLIQTESENPIEMIRGIQKLGILNLVLPKGTLVSAGTIESDRVSERTLQTGMGIIHENDSTVVDKVVLLEYLLDSFDDFTEAGEEETAGLKYQVEYAVGQKESDSENLIAVLNRLLIIREASNYLYLLQDPVKQQEVHSAAITVSSLLGLTVTEPVVAEMLRLCWAYGESILDLRELLEGGKIPLVKDAASWQLSLNMLGHLQEDLTEQHSSENGLNYQWYLRLLLAAEEEEDLTFSLMDLLEHSIRNEDGREDFRLDNCVVSMTIQFRARQENLFQLQAERSWSYSAVSENSDGE